MTDSAPVKIKSGNYGNTIIGINEVMETSTLEGKILKLQGNTYNFNSNNKYPTSCYLNIEFFKTTISENLINKINSLRKRHEYNNFIKSNSSFLTKNHYYSNSVLIDELHRLMDEKKESVEIVEKCKEILRYLYKPDYHSSNLLDSSEIIQTAKNLKRDLIQSLFEGKYITNFNDEGKDEYTNFLNEIIQ